MIRSFLTFNLCPDAHYVSDTIDLKNDITIEYHIYKEEEGFHIIRCMITAGVSVKHFYDLDGEAITNLRAAMTLAEIDFYKTVMTKLYDLDQQLDGRISTLVTFISAVAKIPIDKQLKSKTNLTSEEEFDYFLLKDILISILDRLILRDNSILTKYFRRDKRAINALVMEAVELLSTVIDKERSDLEIVYSLSLITTSLVTDVYYN